MLRVSALALVLASSEVSAQSVPESVHSLANGPETICEITAGSAIEFRQKVEQATDAGQYDRADGGPRFDLFNPKSTSGELKQWVFAKSTEAAYPMGTCRRIYTGPDGGTYQERRMRCDASRAACDSMFIEFQSLDDRVTKFVRGRK